VCGDAWGGLRSESGTGTGVMGKRHAGLHRNCITPGWDVGVLDSWVGIEEVACDRRVSGVGFTWNVGHTDCYRERV
jgi:hypothetical protein